MGKAATRAKNKYNAAKYDRIRVIMPKGKRDEYMILSVKRGYKSLHRFIIDAMERMREEYEN